MWSFWDASDLSGTYGSQVINVWKKIFFLATFWRPLNLTALWDMHRFWNKFLKNHLIFFEMGLLWWNTLSRNKIWYKLYSDIWTKLTVQAPDRTWDEDLLPFKKTSFFPLYVEYVDEIFNPHPHIPHMRIIRIFRIFRIRMANPSVKACQDALWHLSAVKMVIWQIWSNWPENKVPTLSGNFPNCP